MNRTKLKNYAPQARRDFIQAMTDRAAFYGLTVKRIEPVVERGDVAVIAGREHPRSVARKRKQLEDRIHRNGFAQTMEAMAYTWFNRLVAIRFMELHGYLGHGYRVLSNPEGKPTPEILEQAEHVDLPSLKRETIIDLKLAGNKEAELYRRLLTAQCNALHDAMPFLFEKIEDETELLLPDSLLNSDSLIRKLVGEIDEQDWQHVEIIGWLYQFYISEKKDEVMGKVVASEDIPAATQLFTPNWIVKYLVQNTLGRQWMATYPQSSLRGEMKYYIESAEQTPKVQEQLKAITPSSLNPEELTLLDPACGSGHILVEAYDLFKAIYLERGYRAKDIPALILQKNLFGLEIDDRAAQLAAFALMMKARADDRRIFDSEVKPNIIAFEDSQGMNAAEITHALNSPIKKENITSSEFLFEEIENEDTPLFGKGNQGEKGHVSHGDIGSLLVLFENAKTFGSLIRVPPKLAAKLPEIEQRLDEVLKYGDLTHASAHILKPFFQQARLLVRKYDAVVANPPYMNSSGMISSLRAFVAALYPDGKADLFAAFIAQGFNFAGHCGYVGLVTMQSWMFLKTFQMMRTRLLSEKTVVSLAHLGPRAFSSISGEVVSVAAFCCMNNQITDTRPLFLRLVEGDEERKRTLFRSTVHRYQGLIQSDFHLIPGSPVSYWASDTVRQLFASSKPLVDLAAPKQGMATTKDELFIRQWHEVSHSNIGLGVASEEESAKTGRKWFPFNKGGGFRKWFGNNGLVVNYRNKGQEVCDYIDCTPGARVASNGRVINRRYYFRPGITWGLIAGNTPSFRYFDQGFIISHKGCGIFLDDSKKRRLLLGYLNSCVASHLIEIISPSQGCEVGHLNKMPVPVLPDEANEIVDSLIAIHETDWNSLESAWEFESLPLVEARQKTLGEAFEIIATRKQEVRVTVKRLEEENNRIFIGAYGLQDELSPEVSNDQITLDRPDREEDIKRLISYAVGCTMGRYSLDTPGLIYAHGGNVGFDSGQYKTFLADPDGIVPVMEADWFADDAANRFVEFLGVAWPREGLDENLKFVADSLGPSKDEHPRDTIRRYLATAYYKHHLQTYKRRPIYWLFSSGKQRTFQCLVYLHRYNEGTLARMRTEYVIPLQGQIAGRIEQLEGDKLKATSTSHRKKLQKEQDDLKKQQAELHTFEEKLKHAADQKISLDLDDGVKVNYAKFGDLLAEAKAITGGRDEE